MPLNTTPIQAHITATAKANTAVEIYPNVSPISEPIVKERQALLARLASIEAALNGLGA